MSKIIVPKKRRFSNSPCTPCLRSGLSCDSHLPCGSCAARSEACFWLPKMKRRASTTQAPVRVDDKLWHWQKRSSFTSIEIPLPDIFSAPCCPAYLDNAVLATTSRGLFDGPPPKSDPQWGSALAKLLPRRSQCDLLVRAYIDEISWSYRTLHYGTFWAEYECFWNTTVKDMNVSFLALVFSMLAVISLFLPQEQISKEGYSVLELRKLSNLWYNGCRQALIVSGFETQPNLTHLHTFSVLQTYFYAINDSNTLHSLLGQAVVSAHILGLHDVKRPSGKFDHVEYELKKRLWWDLCSCDTYQAFCMSRPPLIRCTSAVTPLPSNCHDSELTRDSVVARPISEPTYVSVTILIINLMRICNTLWEENGVYTTDINRVIDVDRKMDELLLHAPWYLQFVDGTLPKLPPVENLEMLHWQFHNLSSCIKTQKLRMFRVYLSPRNEIAYRSCLESVHTLFRVYNELRKIPGVEQTSMFLMQGHQNFSGSVALAAFLLVEQPPDADDVIQELVLNLEDMKLRRLRGVQTPVVHQGIKIISKLLASLGVDDARQALTGISDKIYSVFGGKVVAKSYVDRAKKKTAAPDSPHTWAAFNGLLENLDWSQWDSFLLE